MQTTYAQETLISRKIKPKTVTPPKLGRPIPDNPFKCDRLIKYNGKTLPCDSHLKRDGENLRAIFAGTPDSISALDRYQKNRRSIRFAAYTGTTGIAIALLSAPIASLFVKNDATHVTQYKRAQDITRWGGIGITAGSVLYGLSVLKTNESNLDYAILRYNQTHPDKPIEILFQTKF